MVNTITVKKSWQKAFQKGREFGPTPLKIISGVIPQGLRGSFYRNGPALFERGGQKIGHWCDGDGAILGVHFTNQEAMGVYRYVQTEAYKTEEKAGKFIFGSYGQTPTGPIWKQLTIPMKNSANNAVLALPDRLLALWEAGNPSALDLQTLDTLGLDEQMGLEKNLPYSAHPKKDPDTGDIYNFGVSYGTKGTLHLYRSDFTGKIQQQKTIPLDSLPLIHDFVLTAEYLVFFIPPVRLNLLPFLSKQKSFSESLSWQPSKGTEILVIDRKTFSVVSQGKTKPWFQWRFGNGYVDDLGMVIIEVVRYDNFDINQRLAEIPTGEIKTTAQGKLWQIHLDPQSAEIITMKPLFDQGCEYPTINPHLVGKPWRFTYLAVHQKEANISQELPGAIACFDYQTEKLTVANLGENRYPVSPIYAPDLKNPDQGWILTEIFDGNNTCSEIWIFDADCLDVKPICKLALPYVVPFGFHGTWKSA